MNITYIAGFLGAPDQLKAVSFCCDEMTAEIISHKDIRVAQHGVVLLQDRKINFCPLCGKEIQYTRITSESEKAWREETK